MFTVAAHAEVTLNSVRVAAADQTALARFYQSAFGMHEVNRLDTPSGPEFFLNFGATADAAKANKNQPLVIMHRDSNAVADPIAGYDRFEVTAPHRAAPIAASVWYPVGTPTYRGLIGDNAVFEGTPAYVGAAIAENDARFVVASSFGYGFVTRFENFTGRNKAGKQLINADDAADILRPTTVTDTGSDWVVSITSAGHLLAFPISELPELDKGKGNKLIQIPPAKLKSGEEKVIALACVRQGGELIVYSGRQKLVLSWRDLQAYEGTRASRGHLLPRGFTKVDRVEAT